MREHLAGFGRDQRSAAAVLDRSEPRLVADQARRHDAVALGGGQEGVAQADQAAGRDGELEADAATAVVDHVEHPGPATADQFGHGADEIFGAVDRQLFDRFLHFAIDEAGDDFRSRDLELVALTAHRFDQDRKVQLATTRNREDVRLLGRFDAQGEICFEFAVETLADLAGGLELAILAGQRRRIDPEGELEGRLFDLDRRELMRIGRIGQGGADLGVAETSNGNDLARARPLDFLAAESVERAQPGDLRAHRRAIICEMDERIADRKRTAVNTPDGDAALVRVVIERADQQLGFAIAIDRRRGYFADDRFEQRAEIILEGVRRQAGASVPGDRIDDRELELIGIGGEFEEEILGERNDFVRTSRRAIELVHDHDRTQTKRQRLLQHRAGLRHRPLDRIDEQEAAIGHVEDALDLTAEVSVTGGVDDVDLVAAVGDRRVLGEHGDTALAFEIVGIHDQVAGGVGIAEHVRLLEQTVDERGLAVIDVGDDGDVSNVIERQHAGRVSCGHVFRHGMVAFDCVANSPGATVQRGSPHRRTRLRAYPPAALQMLEEYHNRTFKPVVRITGKLGFACRSVAGRRAGVDLRMARPGRPTRENALTAHLVTTDDGR